MTNLNKEENEKLRGIGRAPRHHRGRDKAVSAVANVVRRNQRMGLGDKQPSGSFLFLGTTGGTGKTELSKALASLPLRQQDMMVRIDMSEYQGESTMSRLMGTPPGYVGHDEGRTTNRGRAPATILGGALRRNRKRHPDVFKVLLQSARRRSLTSPTERAAW